jgi:small subunit ribosomal protein S13
MPRIIGIDIPAAKRLEISLTYIYGIGRTLSNQIIAKLHLNKDKRAKDLTDEEVASLNKELSSGIYALEGDLRQQVMSNISRLKHIGCYRGIRHRSGLPVRGQRTRTNSRTRKGKRKTVAGKKMAT